MNRKQARQQAKHPRRRVAASVLGPASNAVAVEAALAAALQHLRAGEMQQAEASYRRVLEARPNHPEALHLLGFIMHYAGRKDAAADLIGKAIALRPDYAEAHNNLGNVLADQGRFEEAIASYRTAIALDPNHAETHSNLGTLLCGQGKLKEALASCQRATALDPNLAGAHNNLGFVLQQHGMFKEAVASYRKAIALDPAYAEAHNNLGNVLTIQGKAREAIASFRTAIALKPNYPEAHMNLGIALRSRRKFEEAIASHQRAIALKPKYVDAHISLGRALKGQGRLDEAIACYRRAFEIKPDHVGAHFSYAWVHKFFPGDPEIERLKELLELEDISETQRGMILFSLGKAHDDIGRYAEAFSYFSTANEEDIGRMTFDASDHRKQTVAIKHLFRERHKSAGESSEDAEHVPVIVVGMSRSGKTLVESLLSQHEDAYGAGESHEWSNAIEAVLDKHSIPELAPKDMASLSDDHIREIGRIYMGSLVENSPNSRLFIDTLPGNYRYIAMILQALPMAKIIYCHRDPIDNCLFVYFYRYAHGHYYSHDLINLASFYADYRDLMAHWRRLYEDRILSVRYEELVRNPADIGARIYQFCGLDYDATAIRCAFTTDEIGHWKHYEPYLGTLRQALGRLAR